MKPTSKSLPALADIEHEVVAESREWGRQRLEDRLQKLAEEHCEVFRVITRGLFWTEHDGGVLGRVEALFRTAPHPHLLGSRFWAGFPDWAPALRGQVTLNQHLATNLSLSD